MDSSDFSKYEMINEQNKSTHLDILDNNEQGQDIKTTELSQIHEKEQLENQKDKNIDNPNTIKEISHYGDQSKSISVHNLLYGNPIDLINPKFIGKSFAFLYDFKGDPKITIGPDCKLKNIKLFYFYS